MKKSSHRYIVNFYFFRLKQQQINTELCNIKANLQFITHSKKCYVKNDLLQLNCFKKYVQIKLFI